MRSVNLYERGMEDLFVRKAVESFVGEKEGKMSPIHEETWRQLRDQMDIKRKLRSQRITGVRYIRVLDKKGWIKFETDSQTIKGKTYEQYIKLLDVKDIDALYDMTTKEAVRALMHGNIAVHCSCPDFCLQKDTKIKLLDGRVLPVEEMKKEFDSGKKLWVYSTDSSGDFKPGEVEDVWVSGKSRSLIKVTLDNGREVITTGNHKYMMRDGSYLRADKLEVGSSLMPLYFKDYNGYESVKMNSDGIYYYVYKIVAGETFKQRDYEEVRERSGEEKISVHHKDFLKENNSPENLDLVGVREHIKYYAEYINEGRKNDKRVETHFNSFSGVVERLDMKEGVNHKVVKVEEIELENEEPVYDIQVKKYHNFYVDAGVMVHNCYRGFTYMGYNLGYGIKREHRFPKIRNPNLEGTVCKHLGQVLKAFMMYWTTIHKDMVRTRFFKGRWED